MEWFSLHDVFDSEELRLSTSMKMFTSAKQRFESRTMAEIEPWLREVHKRCVANEGYL